VRSWDEDLAAEAARKLGEEPARELLRLCSDAISDTYKADVPATYAVTDLMRVKSMLAAGEDIAFDLWEAESFTDGKPAGEGKQHPVWRLTIYRVGTPITLTDVLPRLQHMGLDVVDEHPYEFSGPCLPASFWIYDLGLRRSDGGQERCGPVKSLFEAAL